jgi:hypothetical protein
MMQFSNQLGSVSTKLLRQKVAQEALAKDVQQAIIKELGSPSQARICLELLETCISFLQATGGSFVQHLDVGDKPLGEYVKAVLLMEEAQFGSSLVSREVKLKHIDSLWKLLRDYTVVDPFANVRPKYRQPATQEQSELLVKVAPLLDLDVLLPLVSEFICSQLTEDHLSADSDIKDTIGYLEAADVFLVDLAWFSHFPAGLTMAHVLDMYKTLEAAKV